jgi:hypothetical protein
METEGELITNAVVGIGVNVRAGIESEKLEDAGVSPVSLEGISRRRGVAWGATRIKVLEWVVGWYGVLLARAEADPASVRDEFSREVARTPLSAHVAGYREHLKPLRVERGGALEVRRANGKKAVVSVGDCERLSWRLLPEPSPKRKVTARGARRPSSPRRSSRARSARSARRGR